MDMMGELTPPLILIFLIVKEAFSAIAKARAKGEPDTPPCHVPEIEWDKVRDEIHQLAILHDQKDSDGVPVWYVRRSLEAAVTNLAATLETMSNNSVKQMELLSKLVETQNDTSHAITALLTKLDIPRPE